MAIATVAELITKLEEVEGLSRFADFEDKWWPVLAEINSTQGVADLKLLCDASAVEFNTEWLKQQRAKLHFDRGIAISLIDAMPVTEFAELLGGGGTTKGEPRGRKKGSKNADTIGIHRELDKGTHREDIAAMFGITPAAVDKAEKRRTANK